MQSNGRALHPCRPSASPKVAALNYIGLVYALIFGVTIFGERYTAQTVFGI